MRVREAGPGDRAPIVRIYNHYVLHTAATFEVAPTTVEEREGWFEAHRGGGPHRLLVAVDDLDEVLGWASSSPFRPRAAYATTVESSVYCAPEHVGRGVGGRLYASLLAELRSFDVERVVAGVTLPNPASLALHRRFGFRPVGVFSRVGRKLGRYWDVAWFERSARAGGDPLDRSRGREDGTLDRAATVGGDLAHAGAPPRDAGGPAAAAHHYTPAGCRRACPWPVP